MASWNWTARSSGNPGLGELGFGLCSRTKPASLACQTLTLGGSCTAGALDAMLFKVAEYYEQEVNNAVDALSSLIEPFIMIFIGGVVGAMVVGMYLPIFKLAATM